MKRILITGSCGFVGSALYRHLERAGQGGRYELASVDTLTRGNPGCIPNLQQGYEWLHADQLANVDVIVHLAAHATVAECQASPLPALYNNFVHPVNFVTKLNDLFKQAALDVLPTFIYASTGSLHSAAGPSGFSSIYDMTKRALEEALAHFYPGAVGLRFGTVCGASPNPRRTMLNAMVDDALAHGRITVQNGSVYRPILGMRDLCDAIEQQIEQPVAGVHDLSSFAGTVAQLAGSVAAETGAKIDLAPDGPAYDFQMGCAKWFNPQTTLFGVIDDLIDAWHTRNRATRNAGEMV